MMCGGFDAGVQAVVGFSAGPAALGAASIRFPRHSVRIASGQEESQNER